MVQFNRKIADICGKQIHLRQQSPILWETEVWKWMLVLLFVQDKASAIWLRAPQCWLNVKELCHPMKTVCSKWAQRELKMNKTNAAEQIFQGSNVYCNTMSQLKWFRRHMKMGHSLKYLGVAGLIKLTSPFRHLLLWAKNSYYILTRHGLKYANLYFAVISSSWLLFVF